MALLIVFFLVSILFSFLCSIWEAVLLSITPRYMRQQQAKGGWMAEQLEAFKSEIDKPLSAILSLNTIAHTVGAIGVGAQAGELFGTAAIDLGVMELSMESIIAGGMTLAILIFSEIIPKTIGANNWKSLAPFTVRSLKILLILLAPLVFISQWITRMLKKKKDDTVLSRSDFLAIAKEGLEGGTLNEQESDIIKNLLTLDKLKVTDVMTPRPLLKAAEQNQTAREWYEQFHETQRFSRIPIYESELEQFKGFVRRDEILEKMLEAPDTKLSAFSRPIFTVNQNTRLPKLTDLLAERNHHIALVVDDFGSVLGLVTIEDLMETLLGIEIMDETDEVADLQAAARKLWQERAREAGLDTEG